MRRLLCYREAIYGSGNTRVISIGIYFIVDQHITSEMFLSILSVTYVGICEINKVLAKNSAF